MQASSSSIPISTNLNKILHRDKEWLLMEVCEEFQRDLCSDSACSRAHCNKEGMKRDRHSNRVFVCFQHLKGECRVNDCKYYHAMEDQKRGINHIGRSRQIEIRRKESLEAELKQMKLMQDLQFCGGLAYMPPYALPLGFPNAPFGLQGSYMFHLPSSNVNPHSAEQQSVGSASVDPAHYSMDPNILSMPFAEGLRSRLFPSNPMLPYMQMTNCDGLISILQHPTVPFIPLLSVPGTGFDASAPTIQLPINLPTRSMVSSNGPQDLAADGRRFSL